MEKWEVGPTENVVAAFMETLVDPLPYLRPSATATTPSQDAQKSVATQMHAVVLLYNYYHRRQKPDLEFLDFVSFCKLAVSLRPTMIAFMKLLNKAETVELTGAEDQLSLTEKAIKDACDIALALDATIDVPKTEGWPISKTAVLLLDKTNENCKLQFGAITEGVWSTYEKEVRKSYTNPEFLKGNKVGSCNKRKRNVGGGEFKLLAFEVVKEITGLSDPDLVVLGSAVTYSLSREKSATQFYLIECPQTFSPSEQMPIKDLVKSLQGPLAVKDYGSWVSTRVVDHHHMLPYLGSILRCLSRKNLGLPSLCGSNPQNTDNSCGKDLTQNMIPVSPVSDCDGKELDHNNNNCPGVEMESHDKIANINSDNSHKKYKPSCGGEAAAALDLILDQTNSGNVTDELRRRHDILASTTKIYKEANDRKSFYQKTVEDKFNKRGDALDSAKKKQSNKLEILETEYEDLHRIFLSNASKSSSKTVIDGSVAKKPRRTSDIRGSVEKDESGIQLEKLDKEGDEIQKVGVVANFSRGLKRMETSDLSKTFPSSEGTDKTIDSSVKVYHHTPKNKSSMQHDVHDMNVGIADTLKSPGDKKVSGVNGDLTILDDQNEVSGENSEGTNKKLGSDIIVYDQGRKSISLTQHDAHDLNKIAKLNVGIVDPLKSHEGGDKNASGQNGNLAICYDQNEAAVIEKGLVPFEAVAKNETGVESIPASLKLQNALSLLLTNRAELYSQICSMEDELADHEDAIRRIRDDSNSDLAEECLKSILTGKNHLRQRHESQIQSVVHQPDDDSAISKILEQMRLSGAFLPEKTSCQELEDISQKINWKMPRYIVESSNGKFLSRIFVGNEDFQLDTKSASLESNPRKARESAAAQMLAKLRGYDRS